VRGGFDFSTAFDMRALDIDWASSMLKFVKDMLLPLDTRGDIDRYPLMEFGFNLLDSTLGARCLPGQETSTRKQMDAENNALAQIFSGGSPELEMGIDFGGRAQIMLDELKRSPERQQALMSSVQTFMVFTNRLDGLVNNQKQKQGENATIGQTLTEDPLKPESAPEQLVNWLKSLKVTWQTDPQEIMQALPMLQEFLGSLG